MKPAAGSEVSAEQAQRSGWMVSDPFTCQGRAHTGGSVQLHRDGRNAAGQETKTDRQSVETGTTSRAGRQRVSTSQIKTFQ